MYLNTLRTVGTANSRGHLKWLQDFEAVSGQNGMPCFRGTGNQAFQALDQQTIVCQWILIDLECVELVCYYSALLYTLNSLSIVLLLFSKLFLIFVFCRCFVNFVRGRKICFPKTFTVFCLWFGIFCLSCLFKMMDFAAMLLSFTALFMLKISSLPELYHLFECYALL